MFYLILAICCSAAIALILKWGGKVAKSQEYVLTGNYLSATFAAGIAFFLSPNAKIHAFIPKDILTLCLLSLTMGILLYSAFRLYQQSIHKNGVAITGAFAKMGVLIPTLVSMIVWREFPTGFQTVGILLTLIALGYYYTPRKDETTGLKFSFILLILMIANGLADFMTKIFQKYFEVADKEFFLVFAFFSAFLISLFYAKKDSTFSLRDFSIGILLGIPNVFSSYFLIMALQTMIATLVFPIFSAGSLVLITLGGLVFFKERLGKRERITISGILAALVLINL